MSYQLACLLLAVFHLHKIIEQGPHIVPGFQTMPFEMLIIPFNTTADNGPLWETVFPRAEKSFRANRAMNNAV